MYKVFEKNDIENGDLIGIVHYLIAVLNKFKSKEGRAIDIKQISNSPTGRNLKIANEFLNEINAIKLIEQKKKIDFHINALYNFLKDSLFKNNSMRGKDGLQLLNKLRSQ